MRDVWMAYNLLHDGAAVLLATIIFIRAACVCWGTTPQKHAHPVLFLGFGYSYIILGAGALFSAVELIGHDMGQLPLWLILFGSAGLIAFDRRQKTCWTQTNCPMSRE